MKNITALLQQDFSLKMFVSPGDIYGAIAGALFEI